MGYFDYLDEATKEQREFQSFDVWAKAGTYVGLGSLVVTIVAILIFCLVIPLGQNIWLDFLVGGALGIGITGIVFAGKAVSMARSIRKKSEIGLFALIWGIFVILIELTLLLINTWMYLA